MNKVSVVGLGSMGAALARALLRSGYVVTVWNRRKIGSDSINGPVFWGDLSGTVRPPSAILIYSGGLESLSPSNR